MLYWSIYNFLYIKVSYEILVADKYMNELRLYLFTTIIKWV